MRSLSTGGGGNKTTEFPSNDQPNIQTWRYDMKRKLVSSMTALLLVLGLNTATVAKAEEPSVTITGPADGAKLDVMEQHKLVYEVVPGPRGDHVHVYIDDVEVDILRELAGSYTLPSIGTGDHGICVRVVNKAHVPIGIEDCITVSME